MARSEARRRFVLFLLSAFALTALAVSGVGLFGVLSGSVAERTHEMSVRVALGASREGIVSLVVRQGLAMTTAGIVIGVAVAAGSSGLLLFGVTALGPLTHVGIVVLLGAGAVVASAMPAVRAGRAEPVEALKAE